MQEKFNIPTTVARTTIGSSVTVSTVNLSNAALNRHSTPFETCMFYSNGHSNVMGRWATEAEALLKHGSIVNSEIKHIVARLNLCLVKKRPRN
jgi:hypothetical protein